MSALDILTAAAQHVRDRAATYDKPEGERSMGKTVQMFNTLTGHELTEEQGWLFMATLKMARAQQGGFRADSYEDGAAYFALAGEAAQVSRGGASAAPKVKTVREALIEAGVPADELAKVAGSHKLDSPYNYNSVATALKDAFVWTASPQDYEFWYDEFRKLVELERTRSWQ